MDCNLSTVLGCCKLDESWFESVWLILIVFKSDLKTYATQSKKTRVGFTAVRRLLEGRKAKASSRPGYGDPV